MPRFNSTIVWTDEQVMPPPIPAYLLKGNPWVLNVKFLRKKHAFMKSRFKYLKKYNGQFPLKAYPELPADSNFIRCVLNAMRANWNNFVHLVDKDGESHDLRNHTAPKLFEPPIASNKIPRLEVTATYPNQRTTVTRVSPLRKWENGSSHRPWTLTAYDLNKGLVKAVSDYPVIEERAREGRGQGHIGNMICQYALFGKQIFSS